MSIKCVNGRFRVPSHTNRSITYSIHYSALLKRWICDCPDWFNRRMESGEDCKHIKEVKTMIDTALMEELRLVVVKNE